MRIHAGNLPYSTTEEILRSEFEPFGQVDGAVTRFRVRGDGCGRVGRAF